MAFAIFHFGRSCLVNVAEAHILDDDIDIVGRTPILHKDIIEPGFTCGNEVLPPQNAQLSPLGSSKTWEVRGHHAGKRRCADGLYYCSPRERFLAN